MSDSEMEESMMVQLLWLQLMNKTLANCGMQEDGVLQDLNDALISANCFIDTDITMDRNITVLEDDEEEKNRLIEELRGQLRLRKEVIKMAGEAISTLEKQNKVLRQLLKGRGTDGSAALSELKNEAAEVVQNLFKNRKSQSSLRSATNEDMIET